MLEKIRFYISPYFLIRYYLRRDIKYFAKKYSFEGKILDVGCGQKPYKFLFEKSEYLGIDFRGYSKTSSVSSEEPDYYFDEKYSKDFILPFENEIFDNSVSFQVIEHHKRPEMMISEMARVTKQDGLILLSCPFIYALHEEPNDFQRLTEYKLRELFEKNKCDVLKIKKQGSLFSVISTLTNEQLNFFAAGNSLNYFLAVIFYPLFLLHQYFSLLMDNFASSKKVFINYAILARKK